MVILFKGFLYILYIPIWWYSNIITEVVPEVIPNALHSNMVIFKFGTYESILRLVIVFTFQYGDIQIRTSYRLYLQEKYLYIPIWWYSNKDLISLASFRMPLYIPIWWYSNKRKNCNLVYLLNFPLYIPIWWYSNISPSLIRFFRLSFTFQYGDIQIL